jgi:hypothetical protein
MASFRNKSADQIAGRIKEKAKKVWDVPEINDPLIQFLIDANASEIKEVYDQLSESEERVLSRFASLLLPDKFTGATPAHALIHARPTKGSYTFNPSTSLYVEKRQKKIYFSPATSFQVVDGFLGVVIINGQVFYPERTIFNTTLERVTADDSVSHISLGLFFREPKAPIRDFSLFLRMDNVSYYEQLSFYDALSRSDCYLNGRKSIGITQIGLPRQGSSDLQESLMPLKDSERKVLAFYSRNFLTIKGELEWLQEKEQIPEFSGFNPERVATLKKEEMAQVVWLDIQFQKPVRLTSANGKLNIAMNIFPVMNRKYHEDTMLFSSSTPKLIPLREASQGNFLLGVSQVFGFPESGKEQVDKKHIFHELPLFSINLGKKGAGSYSLRPGGVGREEVYSLLERFTYVFSKYRRELMLREFIEVLSMEEFENLISRNYNDPLPYSNIPYLLLNPIQVEKDNFRVFVQYWTTQGVLGNQDFQSDQLEWEESDSKNIPFSKDSVFFFSPSTAGEDPKKGEKTWTYLKDILLRRGAIVTEQDAESFSKTFLNDLQETMGESIKIHTRKDYEIHPDPQFGFTRILKVNLVFPEDFDNALKKGISTLLEKELNQNSTSWIPIRVDFK